MLCWWDNANELFTETFIQGEGGGRDGWFDARGRGSPCVWDLEVIWHERQAYVRHVLAADGAGLDAYLDDTFEVA